MCGLFLRKTTHTLSLLEAFQMILVQRITFLLVFTIAVATADYQFGTCLVRNPARTYQLFDLTYACPIGALNSSCLPRTHKYALDNNGTLIERPPRAVSRYVFRPLVSGAVNRPAYGDFFIPTPANDLNYLFTTTNSRDTIVTRYRRYEACARGNCADVDPAYACPSSGQVNNCIGGTTVGYRTNPIKCDCSFTVNNTQCDRTQCYNTSHPDWLGLFTVPYCKFNGVPTAACMNSCAYFNSTVYTCGGNTEYCSLFNCTSNPQCVCEQRQMDVYREWSLRNGTLFSVNTSFPLTYADCYYEDGVHQNRRLLSIDTQIFVTYNLGVLNVNSLYTSVESHLVLHKGSWSVMVPYTGGLMNYPLPNEALVTSGDLIVDVYVNATKVDTKTFYVIGQTLCVLHDCFLCTESFQNWNCLSTLYKTAIVVVLILLFILTLIALPVAVYCIYVLLWLLVLPFRCCFSIVRGFSNSKFVQDTKGVSTRVGSIKNYFYKPDPSDGAKLLMIMFAFGLFASNVPPTFAACSSGIFSVGNFSNCVTSGSNYTCSTAYAITAASIPTVGTSLCFTLTDADSKPVAQGEIAYTSLINTVNLVHLYDTMSFGGFAESSYVCSNDYPCNTACPSIFVNDPTALGQITDTNLQQYPGQQFCRSTAGGWSHSCLISGSDSCVYSGYALVPNSTSSPTAASVYAIGQTTSIPTITVTITDTAGGVTSFSTSISTSAVTSGNYSVQLIGSLASIAPNFGSQNIIYVYDNQQAYIGATSALNQPVAGTIGDIQGDTVAIIRAGGTSAFIYDSTIVSKVANVEYDAYAFVPSGLNKVLAYPQFPTTIAGESFSFNFGSLTLTNTAESSSAILVTLSTVTPVTISRTVSLVCPTYTILNVTGCYSCGAGFSAMIEIQSICAAGVVSVVLSNVSSDYVNQQLSTTSLTIPQTPTILTVPVYGSTSVSHQSLCLTIIGNGGNQTSCYTFTAVQTNLTTSNKPVPSPPFINPPDSNQTTTSLSWFVGIFQNIGYFFQHIFTGVAVWWEKLVFAFFVIISVVIFIFILPYIIRLVKWALSSYKTSYTKMRYRSAKSKTEESQTSLPTMSKPNSTVRNRISTSVADDSENYSSRSSFALSY